MIDTGTLLFSMAAAELDKLDTTVHLQLLCAADISSANAEFGEREHKYRWIQKGCEVCCAIHRTRWTHAVQEWYCRVGMVPFVPQGRPTSSLAWQLTCHHSTHIFELLGWHHDV